MASQQYASDIETYISQLPDDATVSDEIVRAWLAGEIHDYDLLAIDGVLTPDSAFRDEIDYRLNFGVWKAEVDENQFDGRFRPAQNWKY